MADMHPRPFCWACTLESSAEDFYLTVKAALRHKSAEDWEGLGFLWDRTIVVLPQVTVCSVTRSEISPVFLKVWRRGLCGLTPDPQFALCNHWYMVPPIWRRGLGVAAMTIAGQMEEGRQTSALLEPYLRSRGCVGEQKWTDPFNGIDVGWAGKAMCV